MWDWSAKISERSMISESERAWEGESKKENFCLQSFLMFKHMVTNSTTWWFLVLFSLPLSHHRLFHYAFSFASQFSFLPQCVSSLISQCRVIGRRSKTCVCCFSVCRFFLLLMLLLLSVNKKKKIKIKIEFSVQFYAWKHAFSQKIKRKKRVVSEKNSMKIFLRWALEWEKEKMLKMFEIFLLCKYLCDK